MKKVTLGQGTEVRRRMLLGLLLQSHNLLMKGPRLSPMTVTMTPTWVMWLVPVPVSVKIKQNKKS